MFVGKGWLAVAGVVAGCCAVGCSAVAQGRQLTTEDYARAEKFMDYNVNPLVYHTVEHPKWTGRMVASGIAIAGADGVTFTLVDPAKGTKAPAFDQEKLAAALATATEGKTKFDAHHLAITDIALKDAAHGVRERQRNDDALRSGAAGEVRSR